MAKPRTSKPKPKLPEWRALLTGDAQATFATHFAPLATHADSHALLAELATHVVRFSIEQESAFRLDTRGKLGGEVLVVHFRPSKRAEPGTTTTWTCAPPSTSRLAWLPPAHATALAVHNGIAHRFARFARLEPIHFCRLSPRDRAQVVPTDDDDDESWRNIWDNRTPVLEQRSDGYYYCRRKPGADGGPALACLGHDADGLAKPKRKDLTAGDHFLAFTAHEILRDAEWDRNDRRLNWFPC